jgi:hypothetical protein
LILITRIISEKSSLLINGMFKEFYLDIRNLSKVLGFICLSYLENSVNINIDKSSIKRRKGGFENDSEKNQYCVYSCC